tara:strand:- start:10777 stop:10935 length:159 start_codon:yes stop_codon:yes gene_type:complete
MKSKEQITEHLQELYEDREKWKFDEGDIEEGILNGWIEALEYVLGKHKGENE